MLTTRFSQAPPELVVRLETCQDIDQLRRWLRRVVAAPDLASVSANLD